MRIHLPSKGRGRGSREVCWTRRPMRTNLPIRSQGDASILKYYESHKRRLRTKPAIRNQGDASRPESCKPHKRCPLRIHRPFKGQGRGSRKAFWTRRPSRTSLATRSQGDASRPEYCKLLRTRHKRLLLSQFGGVCGSHRGDASSACSSANTEASAEANRGDASSACTEADTNHTQIDSPSYIASIGRSERRRVWCCYNKVKRASQGPNQIKRSQKRQSNTQ